MNISEAKSILLLYRPGTADAEDPQMAEALSLVKVNPELAGWLETHCAAQEALRSKFSQITPPAGLREQIISEYEASKRIDKSPLSVANHSLVENNAFGFWLGARGRLLTVNKSSK